MSTMFLVLSIEKMIPWKYTVLVFSRDVSILLVSGVLFMIAGLRDFRPSIFGKANTFAGLAVFFALLLLVMPYRWVWIARTTSCGPRSSSRSSRQYIMHFWFSTACTRRRSHLRQAHRLHRHKYDFLREGKNLERCQAPSRSQFQKLSARERSYFYNLTSNF